MIEPPRSRRGTRSRGRPPAVDRARAVLGQQLERVGKVALDEHLAGDQPAPFGPEDGAALLAVAEDEVDDRMRWA